MKIIGKDYCLIQKRDLGLLPSQNSLDIKYYIDFYYGLEFIKIDEPKLKDEIINADYIIDYFVYIKKSGEEIDFERKKVEQELISTSALVNKVKNKREFEKIDLRCKILINLANELLNIALLNKDNKKKKFGFLKI